MESYDAELIELMLRLLPYDRASIDELCEHPALTATGALSADEPAQSKEPDKGEGGANANAKGACGLLRKAWHSSLVWYVLYGSLCLLALLSHLTSVSGEAEIETEPDIVTVVTGPPPKLQL